MPEAAGLFWRGNTCKGPTLSSKQVACSFYRMEGDPCLRGTLGQEGSAPLLQRMTKGTCPRWGEGWRTPPGFEQRPPPPRRAFGSPFAECPPSRGHGWTVRGAGLGGARRRECEQTEKGDARSHRRGPGSPGWGGSGKGKGRAASTTGSSGSERGGTRGDKGRGCWSGESLRGAVARGAVARGAGALRGRPRSPDQDPLCPAEPSARSAAAAKFLQLCPLRSEGARGRGAQGAGGAGCGRSGCEGAGPASPPPRAAGLPRPQARSRLRAYLLARPPFRGCARRRRRPSSSNFAPGIEIPPQLRPSIRAPPRPSRAGRGARARAPPLRPPRRRAPPPPLPPSPAPSRAPPLLRARPASSLPGSCPPAAEPGVGARGREREGEVLESAGGFPLGPWPASHPRPPSGDGARSSCGWEGLPTTPSPLSKARAFSGPGSASRSGPPGRRQGSGGRELGEGRGGSAPSPSPGPLPSLSAPASGQTRREAGGAGGGL